MSITQQGHTSDASEGAELVASQLEVKARILALTEAHKTELRR